MGLSQEFHAEGKLIGATQGGAKDAAGRADEWI